MAELGGNRGSVLDSVKQRLFTGTGTNLGRLMTGGFITRVGSPKIGYPKKIPMDKAQKYYRQRLMKIVHRAIAEAVVSTGELTTIALAQSAPVYTGTWVPNYRLETAPKGGFNQFAGFWPAVVRGTPREGQARNRPIKKTKALASGYVQWAAARGDRYKFYLMNSTPYRLYHPWYVQRAEAGIASFVKNMAGRDLPARVSKRIAQLNQRAG